MLLTLETTHRPATDLGFLLHEHPDRVQGFDVPFSRAHGPEYADPGQIGRLRGRGLGRKRSLALREFGLGVEGLERFARREPLYRVRECVFAVLALESEPVDPRL